MEPKRRWLGPPTSFDVEVNIISGGRITIPRRVLTALGLEEGHTVLLHVTTTRVREGRTAVGGYDKRKLITQIDLYPGGDVDDN